jgi:hypothetical protein
MTSAKESIPIDRWGNQFKPLAVLLTMLHPEITLTADQEGLPVVNWGRRMSVKNIRGRNPVTMGIIGLRASQSTDIVGMANFDRTGDQILPHVNIEKMARWLMRSSVDRGDYMVFHFDYPESTYLLRAPWRSALAEAFSGMFLIVHGKSIGDDQCIDCGIKHLRSLTVPVSEGGLKSDNSTVFLEYVDYERNRRFPIVLNGHLYCMITLFRASEMLSMPEFRVAFDQAVSELGKLLPVFDGPFFTYYDDYGNPAIVFYHRIHIHLLDTLYDLTGEQYMREMADKWRPLVKNYHFILALLMRAYTMRIPYLPRR